MSERVKNSLHNIQMNDLEIEALMELLIFAGNAAALFAHNEMNKGVANKNTIKLARLANDANDILSYIKETTRIGEPESEVKH